MILTEAEARTKRCQESFGPLYVTREGGESHNPLHHVVAVAMPLGGEVGAAGAPSGHNMPTIAAPGYCIGSKCMAWRWCLTAEAAWDSQPVGYCGKAGKP